MSTWYMISGLSQDLMNLDIKIINLEKDKTELMKAIKTDLIEFDNSLDVTIRLQQIKIPDLLYVCAQ